jgi:hypothetical protein
LSQFGPQVIDHQVVLPPPPHKTEISPTGHNKTLYDNDPSDEIIEVFAPGLSASDSALFRNTGPAFKQFKAKQRCRQKTDNVDRDKSVSVEDRGGRQEEGADGGGKFIQEKVKTSLSSGIEVDDKLLGLRDGYGASVLHIASVNGYHSILEQILHLWRGDGNVFDANGFTAMDYAAVGELSAIKAGTDSSSWKRCRQLLRARNVAHSITWLADNPHARPLLQEDVPLNEGEGSGVELNEGERSDVDMSDSLE